MLGRKISHAPENNSFAVTFMHLKLREECKEDDMGWEKARWGQEYRVVKIML